MSKLSYDGHGINRDGERIFTAAKSSFNNGGGYILGSTERKHYGELFAASEEMLTVLENFTAWYAEHFEDFTPEINTQLLCLANDAAAVIVKAKGHA